MVRQPTTGEKVPFTNKQMISSPYILLISAWIFFGVSHSVLASGSVKRVAVKMMGRGYKYYRAIYSLIATVTLLILLHYHFSCADTILWRVPLIEKAIATLCILSGFVIMAICIRKYFLDLSGIHAIMGISRPLVLQETGMHAYVRHPLYFGTLLFVWGIFMGYPYWNNLVSCICLTLYTLIGIYFEEKKLELEYGDVYKKYHVIVPALFPDNFKKD